MYRDPVTGRRRMRATRADTLRDAYKAVREFVDGLDFSQGTLREFLEPCYDWDRCPHIKRLLTDGKSVGRRHAARCRRDLEVYLLNDPIADMKVGDLRRGHLEDLKARLRKRVRSGDEKAGSGAARRHLSARTANRVVGILKTALREGCYRGELASDITPGVGQVKEPPAKVGCEPFTGAEIAKLFARADGSFYSTTAVERWFRQACKLLGIPKEEQRRRKLSPHRYRDSFVTRARQAGLAIAVVQEWVGHVEDSTTDLYTEYDVTYQREQMQRKTAVIHRFSASAGSSASFVAHAHRGEDLGRVVVDCRHLQDVVHLERLPLAVRHSGRPSRARLLTAIPPEHILVKRTERGAW